LPALGVEELDFISRPRFAVSTLTGRAHWTVQREGVI